MQEAIQARIKGYPKQAQAELHRARCTLPVKVAHILKQQPQMISPAVQTFHYRDLQDMKAAAKLALFPPQVTDDAIHCRLVALATGSTMLVSCLMCTLT